MLSTRRADEMRGRAAAALDALQAADAQRRQRRFAFLPLADETRELVLSTLSRRAAYSQVTAADCT